MPLAPRRPDRAERLRALRNADPLNAPRTRLFDSLIRLARGLFDVPMAGICLLETDPPSYSAVDAAQIVETNPELSFAAHVARNPNDILCVTDARADPRFAQSPAVVGEPFVRFYAGAPLVDPDGHVLGTFGIADTRPRSPDADALDQLRNLAAAAMAALDLHRTLHDRGGNGRRDPLTGLPDRAASDAALTAARPRIEAGGIGRLTMRENLREALSAPHHEQFEAYFQPVLDLDHGRIAAHEALVRWTPPGGSQIGPADFVPIAEESGLVSHLDRWMLDRTCAIASRWSIPWHVSVNISPVTIGLLDVVELVGAALRRTGLHPSRLSIEVTETAALPSRERMVSTISGLRKIGVSPIIDDFGAGHAALAYLRHYPFDLVKTDRCFVEGLGSDPRAAPVLQALVRLARSLGILLVAEGVETEEQLLILYRLGVQRVQGFLLGRPVPAEQIEQTAERVTRKLARVLRRQWQLVGPAYGTSAERTPIPRPGQIPNAGYRALA